MTAIVGLVDSGIVYIGGDSAGASGWSLTVRADAKVFFNAGYLFGFTTSYRMGQLIRYALQPPEPARDPEPEGEPPPPTPLPQPPTDPDLEPAATSQLKKQR